MRISFVLFIILLVLIGFGYLLSDNSHMQAELSNAKSQVIELNRQIQNLQDQYTSIHTQNEQLKDQVSLLTEENSVIHQQVSNLETSNNALKTENKQLRAELDTHRNSLPFLQKIMIIASNKIIPALFIPIFPLSLGLIYMAGRYRINLLQKFSSTTPGKQTVVSVKMTRDEVRQIIRSRRGN